jgi:hypothetical protein
MLDGGWLINATSHTARPPAKKNGTHRVGPRAGLDGCGKSRPPLLFGPTIVHIIARRVYKECAEKYLSQLFNDKGKGGRGGNNERAVK